MQILHNSSCEIGLQKSLHAVYQEKRCATFTVRTKATGEEEVSDVGIEPELCRADLLEEVLSLQEAHPYPCSLKRMTECEAPTAVRITARAGSAESRKAGIDVYELCAVLGIEEICCSFTRGIADSIREKALSASTLVAIIPTGVVITSFITLSISSHRGQATSTAQSFAIPQVKQTLLHVTSQVALSVS